MTVGTPEPQSYLDVLTQLIANGPTAAPAEQRPLIGVPQDYVVSKPGQEIRVEGIGWRPGMPTVINPVFREGDEYVPAQLSAEARARLQMRMFDLGILDQDFQVGVWDTPSRLAYRSVLEFANGAGITDDNEALSQYGNLLDVQKAKPKRAPLVVRKTSPEDLRRVFQQAASQALGEKAPDEEVDRMVAAYQGQEASYSRQAWNATYEGGTVTEPPTPAAFAESELERAHPVEIEAYRGADQVLRDFGDIISGPFGAG